MALLNLAMNAFNAFKKASQAVSTQKKQTGTTTTPRVTGSVSGGASKPATSAVGGQGNNAWSTGVDDRGDTDYSVLLNRAMSAGAGAKEVQDLLDARTTKALGTAGYSQYAYDDVYRQAQDYIKQAQLPQYKYQFNDIDEMREAMGYNQVADAQQQAIDAYIKQTVNGLGAQKSGVAQAADEAARQAYVSYMQSKTAMPQALAAAGYTGGMADSQALALETGLQNNQRQILTNRDNALNDIDTAINKAKLEGSIQGAQAQAELGRDAIAAWQNYIASQNTQTGQDFWNRFGYDYQAGQAQLDRDFQAGQAQLDRDWQSGIREQEKGEAGALNTQKQAYESAWNMILAGAMPSDELLVAAGLSSADAQGYIAAMKAQQAMGGSGGYGGGSGRGSGSGTLTQNSGNYQGIREAITGRMKEIMTGYGTEQAAAWAGQYLDELVANGTISQSDSYLLEQEALKILNGGGQTTTLMDNKPPLSGLPEQVTGGNQIAAAPQQMSTKARWLASTISTRGALPGYKAELANEIEQALRSGTISGPEADYLMALVGY